MSGVEGFNDKVSFIGLTDLDARIREVRDYVCVAAERVAPKGWFGV